MPRDYYEVLELPRTADAAAIKKAHRKLARKLHPDVNKDDPSSSAPPAPSAVAAVGSDPGRATTQPTRDPGRGRTS